MNRLGTLLLVAGMSVAVISGSQAAAVNNETVQSTLSTMSSLRGNLVSLNEESEGLARVNTTLIEENELWEDQVIGRIDPKEELFVAKVEAHAAREAVYAQRITRHNDACPSEMDPGPAYNKCKSEEPVLNRLRDKHMAEKAVLQGEQSDLIAERAVYSDQIDTNNTKITANFNRYLEIQDQYGEILARLESLRDRLADLCVEADIDVDGEAIHHCNSVAWDGTKQNLPTLDEILNGTEFFSN